MTATLFSHDSALEIYRRLGSRVVRRPRTTVEPQYVAASKSSLAETSWDGWFKDSPQVHLLVSGPQQHYESNKLHTHAWSSLSEWPAYDLGDGFHVVTPEFLYLQYAARLNWIRLAFLGSELCGTFEHGPAKLVRRDAIASRESIEVFLSENQGAKYASKSRSALRFVQEDCASPMEIVLAMRLNLPVRYGGYGIQGTLINKSVDLSAHVERWYGFPEITPDLHWPNAKLAIEYDSHEHHSDDGSIEVDARRRLALQRMNYHVITVTKDQLKSAEQFRIIAAEVAERTGKRESKPSAAALNARRYLASELWSAALGC